MTDMAGAIEQRKAVDAPTHPALEKHYTVDEVGKLWGLSGNTVRRMFADEGGVVRILMPRSATRRKRETVRIPESVLLRVHTRLRRQP